MVNRSSANQFLKIRALCTLKMSGLIEHHTPKEWNPQKHDAISTDRTETQANFPTAISPTTHLHPVLRLRICAALSPHLRFFVYRENFISALPSDGSQDSTVSIVTRLWAGLSRVWILAGASDFLFSKMSDQLLGPPSPLFNRHLEPFVKG